MTIPRPPGTFAEHADELTLQRARRGDTQALGELYRCYGRACYTLALRLLGNTAAAEDVVQDVFLKLFDAIGGYRGQAPFGAWLKRLTANAAIDQLRAQRRLDGGDPEALIAAFDAAATTAADACDLWSVLQRLPPQARAIVVLHEIEGYTHRELAGLFGQTESYSKSILSRSQQRLRRWLGADGDSAPGSGEKHVAIPVVG